jgi:leader peptidase (prepilin peptidase) / N-methyltransferase
MSIIIKIFVFIFGAMAGSFLNMYIYRTIKNEGEGTSESVLNPKRSYCPLCKKMIVWFDNIPVLSYIFLKGRCRYCSGVISVRYCIVEAFSGVLTLLLYLYYVTGQNNIVFFAISLFILYAMIAVTIIDFYAMIIPDGITYSGIILGLICSVLFPVLHVPIQINDFFINLPVPLNSLVGSLLGIIVGGGILYLIGIIGELILKKEAMGGGDVKLLAMVGAFLGWRQVLLVVFMACILGLFGSLFFIFKKNKKLGDQIPFGPFLAIASVIVMCFGRQIISKYMLLF